MKLLLILLTLITSTIALAGPGDPIYWDSSQYAKFLPTLGFKLNDGKQYFTLSADPTTGAGVTAPIGSIGVRNNAGTGEGWFKTGAADTAWSNFLTGASGWGLSGNAATNPASNYLGTTDAVDLVLRTNGTERFRITSGGSLDTTLGLGVLKSDASGILSSILGTSNQLLGVNNAGTDTEFKSILGTANRLGVTHAANSITLNVDTTFLPSPLAGDANKTLVASGANASSWQLIANANVAAAGVANIARDKLASGTANYIVANDPSGVMSEVAQVGLSQGGTNKNMTASAGSVAYSDADSLELTAVGSTGQLLKSNGTGAPTFSDIPAGNRIWVNKGGNDTTCVAGAINRPCLTITKALTLVTAPASSNQWQILLGVGKFTEATLPLTAWTQIVGASSNISGGVTQIDVTGGNITLAAAWASGTARGGLQDVYLTGTTGVNADLQTMAATAGHVVELMNVGMNGSLVFKANSGYSDFLDANNVRIYGNATITGGNNNIRNFDVYGNMTVTNAGLQDTYLNYLSGYVIGNLTLTASTANAADVDLKDVSVDGTISKSGATANWINTTAAYIPGVSADWSSIPVRLSTALDAIAARGIVKTQSANTVFAGPSSGGAALGAFRALVAADIPSIDLTNKVTGILPVANGGTGANTLTANNVILGNGTSAVQFVAPGASGNVLTSNGTTWTSAASSGSNVSSTAGANRRIEYANVTSTCSGSPCTVANSSGGVTSITRSGVGAYPVNFAVGTFSGTPVCTASQRGVPGSTASNQKIYLIESSATLVTVYTTDSSVNAQDGANGFSVTCMGPN
jgi:hypothetical protein